MFNINPLTANVIKGLGKHFRNNQSINQSEYFIYPWREIFSLQLLLVSIEVGKKEK